MASPAQAAISREVIMKFFWPTFALLSAILLQVPAQSQISPDPAASSPLQNDGSTIPRIQCGHQTDSEVTWDVIYPGTSAQYVGGTVPDMEMKKIGGGWKTMYLSPYQFQHDGRLALSSDCLLFAFDTKLAKDFSNRANYRVLNCTERIDFSEKHHTCEVVRGKAKSHLMMIPYAKVSTLSRAKYANSDLTASIAAATGLGSALVTAISGSVKLPVLGGTIGGITFLYYFFVARPHIQDNYIASFIESPVPQLSFSRTANEVTLTTPTPGYFRPGQKIEVSGVPNHKLTEISTIKRDKDTGEVTVTVKDAQTLPPKGSKVQIAHVSDPSFEGKFQVTSVEPPNKFKYDQKGKGTADAEPNRGEVLDVWNGTFTVDEIKTPTTLTYEQFGADDCACDQDTRGSVGAADDPSTNLEVTGNLAPSEPDAKKTSKSVDLTGTVTVNPPAGKSDDLFKKGDLVIFRIKNFHDYYNISMILSSGTGLTFVNETTDKAGK
jgi:hypothetical protein